jgi:hypothetical protein
MKASKPLDTTLKYFNRAARVRLILKDVLLSTKQAAPWLLSIHRYASAVYVMSTFTALRGELIKIRALRALQYFGYLVQLHVPRSVLANCLNRFVAVAVSTVKTRNIAL